MRAGTDVEFDTVFPATFQRRCVRCEVSAPVREEFLGAQRSETVVTRVTYAVRLANCHQAVVHVQSVLQNETTRLSSGKQAACLQGNFLVRRGGG